MFSSEQVSAYQPSADDCFSLRQTITTDADDHAGSLQHWQQEYHQLSGGFFRGELTEIWFGNIQLFREQTNQAMHETGRAWEGSFTVGIPVHAEDSGVFCGSSFGADSVLTLGNGSNLDFRTPKVLDILGITVDAEAMQQFGIGVLGVDVQHRLRDPSALRLPPDVVLQSRELVLSMLANIIATPAILNYPHVRRSMEQDIYNTLIGLITAAEPQPKEPPFVAPRKAVVNGAREYLMANPEEPVTVADLCSALNVSRRTLQYSFQSTLGVSPVAYLRALRLNGVRRMLRREAGNEGVCVAEFASRWGFWHLSHFAADYKALFGELPSQTLRQRASKT